MRSVFCREPLRSAGRLLVLRCAKRADYAACLRGQMYLSAPAATLGSDHSVLFPATALRYALLRPSTQPASGLDHEIAAGVVAIDRAAQGETKKRARAWVSGGRKAG